MKPKPFESLNHLTVPVVRIVVLHMLICCVGSAEHAVPTDTTCFVTKALTMGDPQHADHSRHKRKRACSQFGRPQYTSGTCPRAPRVCRLTPNLTISSALGKRRTRQPFGRQIPGRIRPAARIARTPTPAA